MGGISIFVDESGTRDGNSAYYLLTLVFHDQDVDIAGGIRAYEQTLADRRLPDIPFHAGPLCNGHDDYQPYPLSVRKQLLTAVHVFVWHLPISYATFIYRKRDTRGDKDLEARMKQDIVNFLFRNLDRLQRYDQVKIYYDGGQSIVSQSLHVAIDYVLSKNAIQYRNGSPKEYRLSQVADYICALELTARKYEDHVTTVTDDKVFGGVGAFKRNYLKKVRRMRFER